MKFIWTEKGYINLACVRRLYVRDRAIFVETDNFDEYRHEEYESDDTAQNELDDMIKELEDDD